MILVSLPSFLVNLLHLIAELPTPVESQYLLLKVLLSAHSTHYNVIINIKLILPNRQWSRAVTFCIANFPFLKKLLLDAILELIYSRSFDRSLLLLFLSVKRQLQLVLNVFMNLAFLMHLCKSIFVVLFVIVFFKSMLLEISISYFCLVKEQSINFLQI